MNDGVEERVREVLAAHGRLVVDATSLDRDDDLAAVGLTSHSSVTVMLGIEGAFDVEFTEVLLRKSTFETIRTLTDAVRSLLGTPVA